MKSLKGDLSNATTFKPPLFLLVITFKDGEKIFLVFSHNLPAGILSSVLKKIKFLAKILCCNFIFQALLQSAQHLYEKREGAGAGSGSGSGSGSIPLKAQKHLIPNTAF